MFWESIRHPMLKPVRNALNGLVSRWPYPVRTRLYTSQQIFVDLRSAIGKGIFVKGYFDKAIGKIILDFLNPGDAFLDVGANIGCYSILALDRVGKDGAVFAFEVDPRSLRCLFRSKMRFGYRNLVVNATAIGETPGLINIHPEEEMGNTYVLQQSGSHVFPMLPLDAFMPAFCSRPVKLIKIDVEGAELGVLRGASEILRKHKPVIIIEVIESHMARFGYDKTGLTVYLQNSGYTMRPLGGSNDPCWVCLPERE